MEGLDETQPHYQRGLEKRQSRCENIQSYCKCGYVSSWSLWHTHDSRFDWINAVDYSSSVGNDVCRGQIGLDESRS